MAELLSELDDTLVEYADAYLLARGGPSANGKTPPSEDDARMGARIRLRSKGRRQPEVIRYELHHRLGITRAVGHD